MSIRTPRPQSDAGAGQRPRLLRQAVAGGEVVGLVVAAEGGVQAGGAQGGSAQANIATFWTRGPQLSRRHALAVDHLFCWATCVGNVELAKCLWRRSHGALGGPGGPGPYGALGPTPLILHGPATSTSFVDPLHPLLTPLSMATVNDTVRLDDK